MLRCPASTKSQLRSQCGALQPVFGFKTGERGHANHPAACSALLAGHAFPLLFSIHQNVALGEQIRRALQEPPVVLASTGKSSSVPPWLSAQRMLGRDCLSGYEDGPLLDTLVPILDAENIYILSSSPACSDQITVYIPGYVYCIYVFAKSGCNQNQHTVLPSQDIVFPVITPNLPICFAGPRVIT